MSPKTNMKLGSLALLALASCASPPKAPKEPELPPVSVKTAPVGKQELAVLYRASGTLRGRNTAVLTSKVVGYVRDITVKAGDPIEQGQPLVTLEANDVEATLRRARAGFEEATQAKSEAENNLRVAEFAARNAKTTHDRIEALYQGKAVSQQDYDDANARYRSAAAQEQMAQARLRGATSHVALAAATIGEAQATLGYSRIQSPFRGRVLERRIDPGALASQGTPLLVVEQEGTLRVEATVEESQAGKIHMGDPATIDIEALGHPVQGKVSELVTSVDVSSRAYIVKVDLPIDIKGLLPGTFARATFVMATRTLLAVPADSVVPKGQLDRVFVIEDGRAKLRIITVGERQGNWMVLLSGLNEGELVAVGPIQELRDGRRVEVKP
ncbi:MAG: efflux RND transporter periplasmic adaptor subunit [Myxococcales bacterium]|jgi:RND family efflux transporter MFP subunit